MTDARIGCLWPVWALLLAALVIIAVLAPVIAPGGPSGVPLDVAFQSPGGEHLLGTDHLGRDLFSRTVWGVRNTLASALLAGGVALVLSLIVGGVAGMLGSWPDTVLMRAADVLLAFPGLLLALVIVAILDTGLWQAAAAVGIALVPIYSRVIRAAVLAVRNRPFVEAARTLGGGPLWILRWHILPNIAGEVLAYASIIYAWSLVNLAALDFLGVSGTLSIPTLGRILGEGRAYLRAAPWIALVPGILLMISVLSVVGLSDVWRRSLPGGQERA